MIPTDEQLVREIVERAGDIDGFEAFRAQGIACGWCAQPVRLAGFTRTLDSQTGEVISSFSTSNLPRGEYLKACGTRRARLCPSCAAIYQGDARQLVLAGLVGGKGVPESVRAHPMVFATLTAPSFGAVHTLSRNGESCHRGNGRCPHGRRRACHVRHDDDDPVLGEPICADCYDYEGTVLFNAHVSELWRRTAIYTTRCLAARVGAPVREFDRIVRLSYLKVAELQRRGAVHLHVVLRADAKDGGTPPCGVNAPLLALALSEAAGKVRAPFRGAPGTARWGTQLDCRPLSADSVEQARKAANYIAKYSVKGSEETGVLDRRVGLPDEARLRQLRPHMHRLVETCWRLASIDELAHLRLREWAHTLGLGCHFLTKSRSFSTTFKKLEDLRVAHRRANMPIAYDLTQKSPTVVSRWLYRGRGWRSRGDAYLARTEARRHADALRIVRQDMSAPTSAP